MSLFFTTGPGKGLSSLLTLKFYVFNLLIQVPSNHPFEKVYFCALYLACTKVIMDFNSSEFLSCNLYMFSRISSSGIFFIYIRISHTCVECLHTVTFESDFHQIGEVHDCFASSTDLEIIVDGERDLPLESVVLSCTSCFNV